MEFWLLWTLPFFALGVLVARPLALLLAAIPWPLFFATYELGLVGPLGEGDLHGPWWLNALFFALLAVLSAGAGVLVRRGGSRVLSLLALAALTVGALPTSEADAGTFLIDERAGEFRGVGYGDSPRRVRKKFGRPHTYSDTHGIAPVGDDFVDIGGPTYMAPARECRRRDALRSEKTMRYPGVTFDVCRERVANLLVSWPGARTHRGVTLGITSLASVPAAYPGVRCGIANDDSDYPQYPYCSGKVSRSWYAWFGRDPVRRITLARYHIP